jgi:nucleoside-diphosphate kinase
MTPTFIILKPDAIERGLDESIINDFITNGFDILRKQTIVVNEPRILSHYDEVIKRLNIPYFKQAIIEEFVGKTVMAIELVHKTQDSIITMRSLIGATDPIQAHRDSIRGKYGNDSMAAALKEMRMIRNLIHASDSIESVQKEIQLWFDL